MFPALRGRPRRVARPLIGLAATLAFVAAPSTVAAHAQLDTISPGDQSAGPAPTEIVGTFTQNLDPAKSSFTVVDGAGAVVAKGGEVASNALRTMTLTLTTPLAPGPYTVRWTTVSTEDGETARDTTTFTVVATSPSPSPASVPSVAPSATPSLSPSLAASTAPTPSASVAPGAPVPSGSDAVIPIVAALIVLAAIGARLLRGRGRAGR